MLLLLFVRRAILPAHVTGSANGVKASGSQAPVTATGTIQGGGAQHG